jgi:multidrug resistance efflux pump
MIGKIFVTLFVLAAALYAGMYFGLIPNVLEWIQARVKPSTGDGTVTANVMTAATKTAGAAKSGFAPGTVILG